ncbi:MAG TPA: glutamate 5-kinase [Chloroflexota bacterium]|nr:glutamate 5-kinase [Chloroflexota bacterium]
MRRVVVKLGSNLLTSDRGALDRGAMHHLVAQVAELHASGAETLIVSSGAVAAARSRFPDLRRRPDLPAKQMLAAIGQVRLMQLYDRLFARHGIPVAQALLAPGDLGTRQGYLNARGTLLGLTRHRVVPVINENDVVATDEIQFGDNDTLSAVVAGLVDADLLVILTDIAGLYTADPRRDARAVLIREVPAVTAGIERLAEGSSSLVGTGGMITKLRAARLATDAGIPMVIADGRIADGLTRAVNGEIGTRFLAQGSGLDARRRWLRAHLSGRGALLVDEGAARALRRQGRSLLPAGVAGVEGNFVRGEPVEVRDNQGAVIGYGLANYAATEAARILGAQSAAIQSILGYTHGDELIHRDNLVILPPEDGDETVQAARPGSVVPW